MSKTFDQKILIASPKTSGMFRHTVVYIHTNDETGAAGAILNVRMEQSMAKSWAEEMGWQYPENIHLGGPVEQQLGYVIHTNDYAHYTSIPLNDYFSFTGGRAIISDINRGTGPYQFILNVGYCGWQPGQLEDEVVRGDWIVADFDPNIFFQDFDREAYWEFAVHVAAQQRTEKLLDTVDTV
jgi:putative transcriptional regulator